MLQRRTYDQVTNDTLEEIGKAGERAASLTQQLLAFSRKQMLQPKTLDLNNVIVDTAKMLQRVIGEDIELTTRFYSDIGKVMADPGQLEQVLVNLSVNARDAMPQGGSLTIGIERVVVDAEVGGRGDVMVPGSYVMLYVTDTGCGMDEQTMEQIFEPFFTTKEVGKGTGLGLSMIQGVITQSGGFIDVESTIDQGTTFKIHLPEIEDEDL